MTDWQTTAATKRAAVLALIPPEWRIPAPPPASEQRNVTGAYIEQYLSQQEIEITNADAEKIVSKASEGAWPAIEITRAFCHRAAVAHQLVHCLHEIFFEDAYHTAQQLDDYLKAHGKPMGPLHGLPVSLKDQFHVRNVETHMGYVGWIGTFEGKKGTRKERVFESEMVRELRAQGAVLFCKTSVPATLMCGETVNNIIGYTHNPTNRHLSSGGSSGGEGALISLHGSPVGFGTDIGGSIRIPAGFNGLYGLRPSSGRLPYEGMANSFDGAPGILSVVGPLSSSVAGLRLVTRSILRAQPWLHDPLVHEIPWREEMEVETRGLAEGKGLCFAVMKCDGMCMPHPPVRRAVDMVVKMLEGLGHKVIEWEPPSHAELLEICNECWAFDGGKDAADAFALSGEEPPAQLLGEQRPQFTASQIMATMVHKRQACKAYNDYWNSTVSKTGTGRPVDALICPLAPFAAARPEKFTYYAYSTFVNVLDYTSVVVPVTRVDKRVDGVKEGFEALSKIDARTQETYDPEIYDGAHVAVQLVGRRLQEEKMLVLAEYVGDALRQSESASQGASGSRL